MKQTNKWLLPDGIDDLLPNEAHRLEIMRRRILDLFASWGYCLVHPPLIEFIESLVEANEDELLLQTFKLTDQLSGKTLGVHADMTPQIARIDAHVLNQNRINRLCYYNTVLKTRPESVWSSRSPIQFGAEVYGHDGVDSAIEVIQLMLKTLTTVGAGQVRLSLGHVGIYTELVKAVGLQPTQNAELIALLRVKAKHEINVYLKKQKLPAEQIEWFINLSDFYGGIEVLEQARERFSWVSPAIPKYLDELQVISKKCRLACSEELLFDLAELPNYHYEVGVVFSAFVPGIGQEVARGGRYDGIGESFGSSRPAVGFSGDIKLLLGLDEPAHDDLSTVSQLIYAPRLDDDALLAKIQSLREAGERVIVQLGNDCATDYDCDAEIIQSGQQWKVQSIK